MHVDEMQPAVPQRSSTGGDVCPGAKPKAAGRPPASPSASSQRRQLAADARLPAAGGGVTAAGVHCCRQHRANQGMAGIALLLTPFRVLYFL